MADSELLTKLADSIDTPELTPQFRNEIILLRAFWLKAENDINNLLSKPEIKEQIQADLVPVFEQITANVNYLFYLLSADGTDGYIVNQDKELLESINYLGSELSKLTTEHNLLVADTEQAIETEKIRNNLQDSRLDNLLSVDGNSGIVHTLVTALTALTGLNLSELESNLDDKFKPLMDLIDDLRNDYNSIHTQIGDLEGAHSDLQSEIEQTNDAISFTVSKSDFNDQGDLITDLESSLSITADAVQSTVSRIDHLLNPDGSQGEIIELWSRINQTAYEITQEVVARDTLENGKVRENKSIITQTAEVVDTLVTSTNELGLWKKAAEETLTDHSKTISVLVQGLADNSYTLQSTLALTANTFGIIIEEDTGSGEPYIAGLTLMLHPEWVETFEYVVGDIVHFTDNKNYKCILNHTASSDNSPESDNADTYWLVESETTKSEFTVRADHFQVITPGGVAPLFEVDGDSGDVTINSNLLVKVIKSVNYDEHDPLKSWFKIDPITGTAEFNNIAMTFGSDFNLSTLQDTLGIDNTVVFSWNGSTVIPAGSDYSNTTGIWPFDSFVEGGAMIEIELDDRFATEVHVALNGDYLSTDLFGDADFGDVTNTSTTGFSDETDIDGYLDFSEGARTYDLGGFE